MPARPVRLELRPPLPIRAFIPMPDQIYSETGMKIALVSSLQDPGGCTIHEALSDLIAMPHDPYPLERHTLEVLRIEERLIYQDCIDQSLDADLIIILSRHSSVNPAPVLTVHVTGNIGSADFGGRERSLPPASPAWMHSILRELSRNAPPGYRVAYEVTHHGPTELETPSLFVEVGSSAKEWSDRAAGYAVARSVLFATPSDVIPLIGFGGTHYAARQTHIALSSRGAFGHMMHSREVALADAAMVRLMKEKSGAVAAYIDKKAVPGTEIGRLEGLLEAEGLVRITEGDLVNMGDLAWETYLHMMSLARETVPGSILHIHPQGPDGTPVIIEPGPELLEEALRCNSRDLLDGLEQLPLAHLSTRKRSIFPVFITVKENKAGVLHDLISLCVNIIRKSERTAVAGDCLTICRRRFDPGKARMLGVPAGPLYGQLMNGRTVQVGERLITPEMVQTCSEKQIHIPGLEKYI